MANVFISSGQQHIFDAVLKGIGRLGYGSALLQQEYEFTDWFSAVSGTSVVPAAAFGRTPVDYDSACIAIFLENSNRPPITFRALGAPFAIEVHDGGIVPWTIGRDQHTTRPSSVRIPAAAMDRFFRSMKQRWGPAEVLRAKNIGKPVGPTELDWVDLGLIPALEAEISTKLDRLLREALLTGQQ